MNNKSTKKKKESVMFSCGKQPRGNLWGQQKKHHGNYAYSEYSTHSSPRWCVSVCVNVLMNLLLCLWMKLSLAPLLFCLFYGCTQNLIHHHPGIIMEISGDLSGLFFARRHRCQRSAAAFDERLQGQIFVLMCERVHACEEFSLF